MPLTKEALAAVLRFGIKYGPVAYAGLRGRVNPPSTARTWAPTDPDPRATAFEHAAHLIDGSVLPVFHGDARVWVVFSGGTPVGSHPAVRVPLVELLEHYDLSKRLRPQDQVTDTSPPRPGRVPLRLRHLSQRRAAHRP